MMGAPFGARVANATSRRPSASTDATGIPRISRHPSYVIPCACALGRHIAISNPTNPILGLTGLFMALSSGIQLLLLLIEETRLHPTRVNGLFETYCLDTTYNPEFPIWIFSLCII